MVYPGLAHNQNAPRPARRLVPVRRVPVPLPTSESSAVGPTPPLFREMEQYTSAVRSPALPLAARPQMPQPPVRRASQRHDGAIPIRNEESDDITRIAARAQQVEWNIPLLVAETVIFSGAILHSWARRIPRGRRSIAFVKVVLGVIFVALYPYYSAISIVVMSGVYLISR